MTVKELAEELKHYPEDAEIYVVAGTLRTRAYTVVGRQEGPEEQVVIGLGGNSWFR